MPAPMNDAIDTPGTDIQTDEDILTPPPSDEALEFAAGLGPTSFWTNKGTACCTG